MDILHTLKEANSIICSVKMSPEWNDVIECLNKNDIDYTTESGRDTAWTDIEMYIYYLEHN